ncbi:MAG TPA: hypothetical protein VLX68_12835 [Chitinivibrionales bacterium]|nr:hypothetical protein [Chitinivibrionales bacterium]
MKHVLSAAAIVVLMGSISITKADTVQVNIKSLLNARAVSTFSNGKIYTWSMGIDGGGGGDGYVTHSVAVHLNYTGHTLPDSARYPANANHPLMILNFSNADSTDSQTHYLKGSDSVTFSVPQGNYSAVYLALTSSEGSTTIGVVLNYTDGPVTSSFTLPDYDQGLTTGVFYVDSAMQKWNNQNSPGDNYGHALNGYGVTANPAKTLTSVKLLKKTTGSYLVLWGVTGVATGVTKVVTPVNAGRLNGIRVMTNGGTIRFVNLPANARVNVFSADGRNVSRAVLFNHEKLAAGVYMVEMHAGGDYKQNRIIVDR